MEGSGAQIYRDGGKGMAWAAPNDNNARRTRCFGASGMQKMREGEKNMMKRWLTFLLGLILALTAACACAETAWTEQDYLTVAIEGVDYILGTSTVEDFSANGWIYEIEPDGVYGFRSPYESYFYVETESGATDAPIVCIDLLYADFMDVYYCDILCDPMLYLYEAAESTQEEMNAAFAQEDAEADTEEAEALVLLADWMESTLNAQWIDDGTLLQAKIPLSDGHVLTVTTPYLGLRLELR